MREHPRCTCLEGKKTKKCHAKNSDLWVNAFQRLDHIPDTGEKVETPEIETPGAHQGGELMTQREWGLIEVQPGVWLPKTRYYAEQIWHNLGTLNENGCCRNEIQSLDVIEESIRTLLETSILSDAGEKVEPSYSAKDIAMEIMAKNEAWIKGTCDYSVSDAAAHEMRLALEAIAHADISGIDKAYAMTEIARAVLAKAEGKE